MIKSAFLAVAFVAIATPASAAFAFLSHTGSGSTCAPATPCNSMATAIGAAGPGGTVVCLNRGEFSGGFFLDINTSLIISCGDGLWLGRGTALRIEPPAGSSVLIEGFVSDGSTSSIHEIEFTGQGTLALSQVRLTKNVSNRNGIRFAPIGPATLHVSDSVFYDIAGSGLLIRPTGSGTANVHLSNVKLESSANGLYVDGSASTAGINVNVRNSVLASNTGSGIVTTTSASAEIRLMLDGASISGNGIGVNSNGPLSNVIIGRSAVTENQVGFAASGGGKIFSYGTNQINGNNNDNVNASTLISQN